MYPLIFLTIGPVDRADQMVEVEMHILVKNKIPCRVVNVVFNEIIDCQVIGLKIYGINIYCLYYPCFATRKYQWESLMDKVERPCIIAADFNAKHQTWGSSSNNQNGNAMFRALLDVDLSIAHDGSPTRPNPASLSMSVIDLFLTSPELTAKTQYKRLYNTFLNDITLPYCV